MLKKNKPTTSFLSLVSSNRGEPRGWAGKTDFVLWVASSVFLTQRWYSENGQIHQNKKKNYYKLKTIENYKRNETLHFSHVSGLMYLGLKFGGLNQSQHIKNKLNLSTI